MLRLHAQKMRADPMRDPPTLFSQGDEKSNKQTRD